jgi:hypothetical protein
VNYTGLIKQLPVAVGFEAPGELGHEDIVARALTRGDLADDVCGIQRRADPADARRRLADRPSDRGGGLRRPRLARVRVPRALLVLIRGLRRAGGYRGCCYLYPLGRRTPLSAQLAECDVDVSWWVTPDAYDRGYYAKLYAALGRWVAQQFPFDRVHYSNAEVPAGKAAGTAHPGGRPSSSDRRDRPACVRRQHPIGLLHP